MYFCDFLLYDCRPNHMEVPLRTGALKSGAAEKRRRGEFHLSSEPRAPRLQSRMRPHDDQMAPALPGPKRSKRKLHADEQISILEAVERLGSLQCTQDELAQFLRVSQPTLSARFHEQPALREAWTRGQSGGRMALRRLLWDKAQLPNASGVKAAIHLANLWFDEQQTPIRDHLDEAAAAKERVVLAGISIEELDRLQAIERKLGLPQSAAITV
jgi:hypothetical protein